MFVLVICPATVAAGQQSDEVLTNAAVVTLTEGSPPPALILTGTGPRSTAFDAKRPVTLSQTVHARALVAMLTSRRRATTAVPENANSPAVLPVARELSTGHPRPFGRWRTDIARQQGNAQGRQRPDHQVAQLEVHHANTTS